MTTDADAPGLAATIAVQHWHMIPGGIEFEDRSGVFVHVLLTEPQFLALHQHMTVTGLRPAAAGDRLIDGEGPT
jgi:hypothetical protein